MMYSWQLGVIVTALLLITFLVIRLQIPRAKRYHPADTYPSAETSKQQASLLLTQIQQELNLEPEEQAICATEIAELERLHERLQATNVRIPIIGLVGVGKTSLYNLLAGQNLGVVGAVHGITPDLTQTQLSGEWTIKNDSGSTVTLIDTPGIAEVDGQQREQIARDIALRADMIVFVVQDDLTQLEMDWIQTLAKGSHKPLIVAFNKVDVLSAVQREAKMQSVKYRLANLVNPANIVTIATAPILRDKIVQDVNGTEKMVQYQPEPDISDLQARMLDMVGSSGTAFVIAQTLLQANSTSNKVREKINVIRDETAQSIINNYKVIAAMQGALNPFPLADVAAGAGINIKMVFDLARLYGVRPSLDAIGVSATEIAKAGTALTLAITTATLLKAVPGLGTLIGGALQGLVAGYSTAVVGATFQRYFREGKWQGVTLEDSLHMTIDQMRQNGQMGEVVSSLAQRLQQHLTK